MKTEDLIARLAADCPPVRPGAVERGLLSALVAGTVGALVALVVWLGLRPMDAALQAPAFWMKAVYALALAAGGWILTRRLARPEGRLGGGPWLVAGVLGLMAALGVAELLATEPSALLTTLLGHTWRACPWRILALSAPILLFAVLSLRRLAPTRLALAGASAGLLAGGLGAAVYGLYCEEAGPAFVAVWYTLGVALCVATGALAGRIFLRW